MEELSTVQMDGNLKVGVLEVNEEYVNPLPDRRQHGRDCLHLKVSSSTWADAMNDGECLSSTTEGEDILP